MREKISERLPGVIKPENQANRVRERELDAVERFPDVKVKLP